MLPVYSSNPRLWELFRRGLTMSRLLVVAVSLLMRLEIVISAKPFPTHLTDMG